MMWARARFNHLFQCLFVGLAAMTLLPATQTFGQSKYNQPNCPLKTCDGLMEPHNTDYYQFNTFSKVFLRNGLHIYQTCVHNVGNKDLELKWYIAGPDTWILKGCAVTSERERGTRKDYGYYSPGSCLRYGNSWKYSRAKFHAHIDETDEIEKDQQKGEDCSKVLTQTRPSLEKEEVRPIEKTIYFFAPYDEKNPEITMAKTTIQIYLYELKEKKTILQKFTYNTERAYLDNADFKIGTFRVVPSFRVRESYIKQADGKNVSKDGEIFLRSGDSFLVGFDTPANPVLTSLEYEVFNPNNTRVGSILIPTWLNAK